MNEKIKNETFKRACPESPRILENKRSSVKDALFNMKDRQFQAGLAWRMKQCESVRALVANGWSREDILREFRHNGMTVATANRIIDDALC